MTWSHDTSVINLGASIKWLQEMKGAGWNWWGCQF